MNPDVEHLNVALSALLRNIARFAQNANNDPAQVCKELTDACGPPGHLIPNDLRAKLAGALCLPSLCGAKERIARVLYIAEYLAAAPSQSMTSEPEAQLPQYLVPVTANVSFDKAAVSGKTWAYLLEMDFSSAERVTCPRSDVTPSPEAFTRLWTNLQSRLRAFPGPVDCYARLVGLLDLMADTLAYVPATLAVDEHWRRIVAPDVDLFNHARLTAAIATALARVGDGDLEELSRAICQGRTGKIPQTAIARLVKLDFSGIQGFIYRITEPSEEREFRRAAKRLRGRSFHLTLLNQALGDWLLQQLKLPPTNLLHAAGGVIEWLLPAGDDTCQTLNEAMCQMQEGLLNDFSGGLGAVWGEVELTPDDFANVRRIRLELEDRVAQAKSRKWERHLNSTFFTSETISHTCAVCELTPTQPPGRICALCERHSEIGWKLPRAFALVSGPCVPGDIGKSVSLPAPMKGVLALIEENEMQKLIRQAKNGEELSVRGLKAFVEHPDSAWPLGSSPGRWSVANAAPMVGEDVADFDKIAALSEGNVALGVLKADADWMGLVMSHGLRPPTFARTATLSRAIHRFFGPYLNELCYKITEEWLKALSTSRRGELEAQGIVPDKLKSLFYIVYAGGDDLFLVGPWDQTIELALRLSERYRAYVCENPALTISAGLTFAKPHFPVQHFARQAEEALGKAKEQRNSITLFGETVPWDRARQLVQIGQEWAQRIADKRMPRSLIHDLGETARVSQRPLFTPTLYYTLTRRLSDWEWSDRQSMLDQVLCALDHIAIPVTYASWKTRERRERL